MKRKKSRRSPRWTLGVSASHNGSACLLRGDEIAFAVQEERLTRVKRDVIRPGVVPLCVGYCLEAAGIGIQDLSAAGVAWIGQKTVDVLAAPSRPLRGAGFPVFDVSHHLSHATGVFAASGFSDAAVLVVDGSGSRRDRLTAADRAFSAGRGNDREIISLYEASGTAVKPLEKHFGVGDRSFISEEEVGLPRFWGLGGMYSAVAKYVFGDAMEAGKVMGLAPYGKPVHPVESFFTYDGRFRFSDELPRAYARGARWPADKAAARNLAASVQDALEEGLLDLCRRLRESTRSRNLCFTGGVALNSVANERIRRESGFDAFYFMPAAEDSGNAIGAAYHALWRLTGTNARRALVRDRPGRRYSDREIDAAVARVPAVRARRSRDVVGDVVDLLRAGKIVGWFQGGSELGPRALGGRSILCDPRSPRAKARLNATVKFREAFRPFAPVLPLDEAADWFSLAAPGDESPFMLRVWPFRKEKAGRVPAVAHADGTGRVQTVRREHDPRLYELLTRFKAATGVPVLLNTSFNRSGEPIVETPEDALWCLLETGLDCCILEDRVVEKAAGAADLLDFVPAPDESVSARALMRLAPGEGRLLDVLSPHGVVPRALWREALLALTLADGERSGRDMLRAARRGPWAGLGAREARELMRQTLALMRRYSMIRLRERPASAARRPGRAAST
jgi:carbamoyltransferase